MNPHDLLVVLGLACTLSCNLMSLVPTGIQILTAYNVGLAGALLVFAVIYRQKPAPVVQSTTGKMLLIVSAAALASGLLPILGWTSETLSQLLGVLSGIGTAYIFYGWFTLFTAMCAKRALCLFLGGIGTASLLRLGLHSVFQSMPVPAGALLTGLAICSVVILRRLASQNAGPSPLDANPLVAPPAYNFGGAIAEIAVFGLIFGLLQPASLTGSAWAIYAGLIAQAVLCAGLIAWFASGIAQRIRSSNVRNALLVASIISVASATFWHPDAQLVAAATISLRILVLTLMYIRLYSTSEAGRLETALVFGIGRGVYGAAELAGRYAHEFLVTKMAIVSLPPNVTAFAITCVFLLLLNSVLRRTLDANALPTPVATPAQSLNEKLADLAASCSLTPREEQVLRLPCDNRSAKEIAAKLGISENTVLTHTKQVYKKTGVHGRQELLMHALNVETAANQTNANKEP